MAPGVSRRELIGTLGRVEATGRYIFREALRFQIVAPRSICGRVGAGLIRPGNSASLSPTEAKP